MEFNRITAAEAAALVRNGQTIGLSGFTPAGVAKCTPAEIAKKAAAEHAAGRPFKISIFTGASTGQSCDGELSDVDAIDFRAPYTTNPDFRKNVNQNTHLHYSDLNLSNMATQIRQGYLGEINWAIIEACAIEKVGTKAHIYLTAAGGDVTQEDISHARILFTPEPELLNELREEMEFVEEGISDTQSSDEDGE